MAVSETLELDLDGARRDIRRFADLATKELEFELKLTVTAADRRVDGLSSKLTKALNADLKLATASADRDVTALARKLDDATEAELDLDVSAAQRDGDRLIDSLDDDIELDVAISGGAKRDLDQISDAAEDATDAVDDLGDQTKDLDKLGDSAEDAADSFRDLEDGADDASSSVGDVDESAGGAETSMAALGVAGAAAAAAFAVIVDQAFEAVDAFTEFETGTNEILTLLPDIQSPAGISDLRTDLLDVGEELGVLSADLLPATYDAISAGVPQENVIEFLRTESSLARAGVTDLGVAVDLTTSVLNAYGLEASEATEVNDLLVLTVRNGKTTIDEMAASFSNVIPIAAAAGVPLKDVVEAVADLTLSGTPTAVATTQIRSAIAELTTAGSKAAVAFDSLAGTTFTAFIAAGGTLEEAFQLLKVGADEAGVSITNSFGSVEAGSAALQLVDIEQFGDAMGATADAAARFGDSAQLAGDKAKAALERARIEVGQQLAPTIIELSEVAVELIPVFSDIGEVVVEAAEATGLFVEELRAIADALPDGDDSDFSFGVSDTNPRKEQLEELLDLEDQLLARTEFRSERSIIPAEQASSAGRRIADIGAAIDGLFQPDDFSLGFGQLFEAAAGDGPRVQAALEPISEELRDIQGEILALDELDGLAGIGEDAFSARTGFSGAREEIRGVREETRETILALSDLKPARFTVAPVHGFLEETIQTIDDRFENTVFSIQVDEDEPSIDAAIADLEKRLTAEAERLSNLTFLASIGADQLAGQFSGAPELLAELVGLPLDEIIAKERRLDVAFGEVEAAEIEGEAAALATLFAESFNIRVQGALTAAIPQDLLDRVSANDGEVAAKARAELQELIDTYVDLGVAVEENGVLTIQDNASAVADVARVSLESYEATQPEVKILDADSEEAQQAFEEGRAGLQEYNEEPNPTKRLTGDSSNAVSAFTGAGRELGAYNDLPTPSKTLTGDSTQAVTAFSEGRAELGRYNSTQVPTKTARIKTEGAAELAGAKSNLEGLSSKNVTVNAKTNGGPDIAELKRVVDSIGSKTLTVTVLANLSNQAQRILSIPGIALSAPLRFGDVIDEPTIALIGEGRGPEAVIPMGEGPAAMMRIVRKGGLIPAMAPHLSAGEFAQMMQHAPPSIANHVSVDGGWSGPSAADRRQDSRRHMESMNANTRIERELRGLREAMSRQSRTRRGEPRPYPIAPALAHGGVR